MESPWQGRLISVLPLSSAYFMPKTTPLREDFSHGQDKVGLQRETIRETTLSAYNFALRIGFRSKLPRREIV